MFFGGGFPFGGFSDFEGGFPGSSHENDEPIENSAYYELLGVEKNATTEQIKKAFKKKAIKEHPDKGGDPQKFAEISLAHDTLSDPNKRKVYDKYGEKGIKQGLGSGGGGGEGFHDIFDLLSGNVHKQQRQAGGKRRTKDVVFPLKITLEDVYTGAQKKLSVQRKKLCEKCAGKGGKSKEKCSECRGQGMVVRMQQLGPGMYTQSTAHCSNCKGQGQYIKPKDRCKSCEGEGTVKEKKVLNCDVSQGTPDGYKYTFYGEADEAEDTIPGDIIVEIQEHSRFKRKGFDLIMKEKISLSEALTGFKLEIPFLDGQPRFVTSNQGEIIQPGDLKTVKELGLPKFTTPYEFGNLFIQFEVEFPKMGSINEQQRIQIRQSLPASQSMKIELPTNPKEVFSTKEFEKSDLNPYKESRGGEVYDEDDYNQRGGGGGQHVRCAQQ